MEKSQIATLDLVMFRKLQQISIGTNEVESICSNLVRAKMSEEGVYREGHGARSVLDFCWRDVRLVDKLLQYKVREVRRFVSVIKRKLVIKALAESYHVGPSVYRKVKKELEVYGRQIWAEGLDKVNSKVKHLLLRWKNCNNHSCCNWMRKRRSNQSVNPGEGEDSIVEGGLSVHTFVHNFQGEGKGEVGAGRGEVGEPGIEILKKPVLLQLESQLSSVDSSTDSNLSLSMSSPDVVVAQVEEKLCWLGDMDVESPGKVCDVSKGHCPPHTGTGEEEKGVNNVSKFSLVMGSGDVVSLYPSLVISVCAYEVGRHFVESGVTVEHLNDEVATKMVKAGASEEEIKIAVLDKTRKYIKGKAPTLNMQEVIKRMNKRQKC